MLEVALSYCKQLTCKGWYIGKCVCKAFSITLISSKITTSSTPTITIRIDECRKKTTVGPSYVSSLTSVVQTIEIVTRTNFRSHRQGVLPRVRFPQLSVQVSVQSEIDSVCRKNLSSQWFTVKSYRHKRQNKGKKNKKQRNKETKNEKKKKKGFLHRWVTRWFYRVSMITCRDKSQLKFAIRVFRESKMSCIYEAVWDSDHPGPIVISSRFRHNFFFFIKENYNLIRVNQYTHYTETQSNDKTSDKGQTHPNCHSQFAVLFLWLAEIIMYALIGTNSYADNGIVWGA